MSQPTPYNRLFGLDDYAQANPSEPYNAEQHDSEFDAVEQTLDGVCTNLALIQRDDGQLQNRVVKPDSLSVAVLSLIGNWNPRGNWTALTYYAFKDVVGVNGASYVASSAHVSTASFAADLSTGYWMSIDGLAALAASTGSSLVGFSHAVTYGQGTSGLALQGIINVKNAPYNAVGNGIADDTAAISSAISAASGKTLHIPSGTYNYNPATSGILLVACKIIGDGIRSTVINITGTGDVLQRGANSVLEDLSILMNGATYSGHCCKFSSGASSQSDRGLEIFNVASGKQALLFDADGGSLFSSFGSIYYTLTTPGIGAAIKVNGTDTAAVPRVFVGAESGGCTLFDFGGCKDFYAFGGFTAGLIFSSSACTKVMLSSIRFGDMNATDVTIDGSNHQISNSVFANNIIFAATSANCRLDCEVPNYSITDNGTNNAFTRQLKSFSPAWTADTANPAIGNGTITGYVQVKERTVVAAVAIVMGGTTTYGTGSWRIGLPYTIASGSNPIGSVRGLRSGVAFKVGTCVGVSGTAYAYVYFDATAGPASATIPHTWAVNDTLDIQLTYAK